MEDHEIVYPTLAAYFYYPEGIATDGTYLYIADSGNNAIRKLLISSGAVSTIAGNPNVQPGSTDGPGTNGTTPSTALFNNPLGICYIAPKYLYIADSGNSTIRWVVDTGNSTIRKLVISSAVVSTLAGQGGVKGDVDGTGSGASFNWPE